MPTFVHLALESQLKSIRRVGISRLRRLHDGTRGAFAMPVVRDFYVSHQWLRELKRRGAGPIAGVYFRIADHELISIGRYNEDHQLMSAANAAALVADERDWEGVEVIIPRRISPKEIQKVRRLPQVIGWRYYPGSHGRKPCGCEFCQRGLYGARKLRDDYENRSSR